MLFGAVTGENLVHLQLCGGVAEVLHYYGNAMFSSTIFGEEVPTTCSYLILGRSPLYLGMVVISLYPLNLHLFHF
jgi:hypothetical protein